MLKKLDGPKLVKRRVTVHIPTDGDETAFAKYKLWLTYEIEGREVTRKRQEAFEAGDPDTDWLREVIKSWDDYMEADGKTPVPFNPDELRGFLDTPWCRIAAIEEYFNCANGGVGKRKN